MKQVVSEGLSVFVKRFRASFSAADLTDRLPTRQFDLGSGLSGLALSLLGHHDLCGAATLLNAAERCIDYVTANLQKLNFDLYFDPIHESSLYFAYPGVWMVRALVKIRAGKAKEAADAIRTFVEPGERVSPDIIWGSAGLLLAALALHDQVRENDGESATFLQSFADQMAFECKEYIDGIVPDLSDSQFRNRSFAHGWPGVAYALLLYSSRIARDSIGDLNATLARFAANAHGVGEPMPFKRQDGNGAQFPPWVETSWCNGASGLVYLWTEAYRRVQDEQYRRLAEDAAQFVGKQVTHDNVRYLSMCCGLTGQAYALTRISDVSSSPAWRERAIEIAQVVERICVKRPDDLAHSLLRGGAGQSLLFAQLLESKRVRLPIIET